MGGDWGLKGHGEEREKMHKGEGGKTEGAQGDDGKGKGN